MNYTIPRKKIDICINNARVAFPNHIFDKNIDNDFENIIQTNLICMNVTKEIGTHIKEQIHGSYY